MVTVTSAVANKRVRELNKEIDFLYQLEGQRSVYTAVEGVNPVVPDYDFVKTRAKISTLESEVRAYKHAINKFNVETVVDGLDMTVDEVLIAMAQLSKEKARLESMRNIEQKTINGGLLRSTNTRVEYKMANFKADDVEQDYVRVCDSLMQMQVKLDLCNNTLTFDVPV